MAEAVVEKKIELRVIAPTMATDKSPYKVKESVDMVIMRCTTGDMGILPGRVSVSAVLDTGVLRVFDASTDTESRLFVKGGVAHVKDDVLTILSDSVLKPSEIDKNAVNAEIKELQRLMDETEDMNEKTSYRKNISHCQIKLDVADAAS